MDHLTHWQKAAFFVAGITLVAGISFLLALSGRKEPVLDKVPQDIVERGRAGAPDIPNGGPTRGGGTLVSPSETVISGVNVGLELPPIAVTNRGLDEKKIKVDFIPVNRFLLEGVPVVEMTKENIDLGKEFISLNQTQINLAPGETQNIIATIKKEPDNGVLTGSIGITVLDKTVEFSSPEKNDVRYAIQNNLRINSMLYASWPGSPTPSLSAKQLRGFQNEDKIDFVVRVQGRGGIVSPIGSFRIENSLGRVVSKRRIEPGQRVVAGSERDIGIDKPVAGLKSGSYEAVATLIVGNRTQTVRWPFQIDRDGKLPTPKAEVAIEARPSYVEKGQEFNVFLQVQNTGTKPIGPNGFLRLYQLGKEKIIEELPLQFSPMSPGDIEEKTEKFKAPKKSGNYEILLELEAEDGSFLDQRVVSVLVKSDPPPEIGPVVKFRDWLSENPFGALGAGMAIFGLLLGALTGIIVFYDRRKNNF